MLGLAKKLRSSQDTLGRARTLTEACLGIFEDVGDRGYCGWAQHNLGLIAYLQERPEIARALLERSIASFRAAGDAAGVGTSLCDLGNAWSVVGDLDRAGACYEESLALLRGAGDHWSLGWTLYSFADLCLRRFDDGRARWLFEEARAHFGIVRYPAGIAAVDVELVRLGPKEGTARPDRSILVEAMLVNRVHGVEKGAWENLARLGAIAIDERAYAVGLRLIGAAMAHDPLTDLRPTMRAELEANLAAARSALGEDDYVRVWAESQAMTLEQAVACALEEDRS
jgi:hypothetical protein